MELTIEGILYDNATPHEIIERCLNLFPEALAGRMMQAADNEVRFGGRLSEPAAKVAAERIHRYRRMSLQVIAGGYDPFDLSAEWCGHTGTLVQALHEAAIILRVPPAKVREIAARA